MEEAPQAVALGVVAVEAQQVDALEEVVAVAGFAEAHHCPWNQRVHLPPMELLQDAPLVGALEVVEEVAIVLEE